MSGGGVTTSGVSVEGNRVGVWVGMGVSVGTTVGVAVAVAAVGVAGATVSEGEGAIVAASLGGVSRVVVGAVCDVRASDVAEVGGTAGVGVGV